MTDPYEREEQDICEREAAGEITHEQAAKELRELARWAREELEERAEDAYREVMDNGY